MTTTSELSAQPFSFRPDRPPMTQERIGGVVAGLSVLALVALAWVHDPWWLAGLILLGLNLAQYGLTGLCPVKSTLGLLGVPSEREVGRLQRQDPLEPEAKTKTKTKTKTKRKSLVTWLRHALKKCSLHALAWLPIAWRDRLVLSQIRPPDCDDVVVKIAETTQEHEKALRLLFDAYAESGLIEASGVPVRVTSRLILPTTIRFVALVRGEVVATMSLIVDSKLGLPLEEAYPEAVARLRKQGGLIAEGGALCVHPTQRRSGLTLLLYKAVWKAAVELLGVSHLVMAVRPETEVLYTAVLRFERLSTGRPKYPGINSDSTAMHLDLTRLEEVHERAFSHCPATCFNPHTFLHRTTHSQIQLPTSPLGLKRLLEVNRCAAMRLAALRPDVIAKLGEAEFNLLRMEMRADWQAPDLQSACGAAA